MQENKTLNLIPYPQEINFKAGFNSNSASEYIHDTSLPEDHFRIFINKKSIEIKYNSKRSKIYAEMLLKQLKKNGNELPCMDIYDYPKYSWRGMHLDVSRHFFDVEFVKQYIDILSFYRLNYFHMHLTDDQGWRIEISKYPELTSHGAYRKLDNGESYGGFFTKIDIAEIIDYADEKGIEVIPEVDMPGHMQAAVSTYNYLSCKDEETHVWSKWGVSENVLCPGKETTYEFAYNVLDEIISLFPSKFIHIGGDECPKENWKHCDKCQKILSDNDLTDENELQAHFIKNICNYLHEKGKIAIGWDEILEGDLQTEAWIMAWRNEGAVKNALEKGFKTIVTPNNTLYFDWKQTAEEGEKGGFGVINTKKVYSFDPNPDKSELIVGAQANLWTELIPTPERAFYMLFPRVAALAEMTWGTNTHWESFLTRLPSALPGIFTEAEIKDICNRANSD